MLRVSGMAETWDCFRHRYGLRFRHCYPLTFLARISWVRKLSL